MVLKHNFLKRVSIARLWRTIERIHLILIVEKLTVNSSESKINELIKITVQSFIT